MILFGQILEKVFYEIIGWEVFKQPAVQNRMVDGNGLLVSHGHTRTGIMGNRIISQVD